MTREERARADRAREMAALYSGPSTELQSGCEVMTIGEAVSFALAFADAEAAAMRERASGLLDEAQHDAEEHGTPIYAGDLAAAIRALRTTGEVGRG